MLGSGCLDLWEEPGFTSTSLAQAVHDALEDLPGRRRRVARHHCSAVHPVLVGIVPFLATAAAQPAGVVVRLSVGHSDRPTIDPIDAYVTLIAALMTRLLHRVFLGGRPLRASPVG